MAREAKRLVTLDDIVDGAFYDDDLVGPTLKAHLAFEALLVELIHTKEPATKLWGRSFPDKTKKAVALGLLSESSKKALDLFNELRNDFAHIFGHETSTTNVHALARELETLGIGFSDSFGKWPLTDAEDVYVDEGGMLRAIVWAVGADIAFALLEHGGRDIMAA